jgi:hypothetical protein
MFRQAEEEAELGPAEPRETAELQAKLQAQVTARQHLVLAVAGPTAYSVAERVRRALFM